ncbi:unnamed protein product, partial [Heterotrigona itama]
SKHKCVKINDNRKRIFGTVAYYNKTKFSVDVTDRMARQYNGLCQVSFNILDLVDINAWTVYKGTNGQNISRQFLLQLAEDYQEFLQEEKENVQFAFVENMSDTTCLLQRQ